MKLRLIQSGGFAGKIKIAEEELEDYSPAVQQLVQKIFSEPPAIAAAGNPDKNRDKETYTLEFNNEQIPLQVIPANEEFDELIKKLKANLKFFKK